MKEHHPKENAVQLIRQHHFKWIRVWFVFKIRIRSRAARFKLLRIAYSIKFAADDNFAAIKIDTTIK